MLAAATMLWPLALRSCSSEPAAQAQAPREPIAHAPAPPALHGLVAWQSLHQRRSPSCSAGKVAKVRATICGAIDCAPDRRWLIAWRKLKPAPMPVKFGIGWYWVAAPPG